MPSNSVHARAALLSNGWADDVRFTIEHGLITAIEVNAPIARDDLPVDHLIPGMSSHHSHAFQRAMSGLSEMRGHAVDTFWTWRDVMYRFALAISPEQMEAIAAQLYMEMLEGGFCRVGEFHYLHHDKDGGPYANIGEMCERIAGAATDAGIELSLLPSFYAHSNFGGEEPTEGQRRFINDLDDFAAIFEHGKALAANLDGMSVGLAPHSLRAVTAGELSSIIAMAGDTQIHIHVAEQQKEVDDCLNWCGQRPLEWLLSHAPVDQRWCLIHSTHLTPHELDAIVKTGAAVGLCPVTEGNLGDGIFPVDQLLRKGGKFGIGTDSNISISVAAELRQLEYSQRLSRQQRSVVSFQGQSTGRILFDACHQGGQSALAVSTGLEVGAAATFVTMDTAKAPWLAKDHMLDGWIFGQDIRLDSVWVRGVQRVSGGQHSERERIASRYRKTMQQLMIQTGLS